eukprot:NODE_17835_length_923_cov_13.889447.p7 GENE.NODE_17835_length_923_cov_13.889447~~NODE_17835_length_923_cov_13.889447.p7  ORF type:complete len:71 (-),score=20.89 NODE_17835_length_923_cov_13.889447:138-350(-)
MARRPSARPSSVGERVYLGGGGERPVEATPGAARVGWALAVHSREGVHVLRPTARRGRIEKKKKKKKKKK